MITYRPITTIDEIHVLKGRTSTFQDFTYEYDEQTITMLKDYFSLPHSLYIKATDGDAFAGFISCDTNWWEPDSFFIREIFVSPDFQQRGIGGELMQRAITHAKHHQASQVVTQTAPENIPMQQLCATFGFTVWDNPRWKDGITYKVSL